ncbi:MAG: thiamine diphosphokinase [Bacillales bacterium]|nr:thiamine diphosphokinase [Bacillales bacterium]
MNVGIVAGGPRTCMPDLKAFNEREMYWIGVDKGVQYLLDEHIVPDLAIGDFDSIQENEWKRMKQKVRNIKKYNPEKDETDMELAIEYGVKQNPNIIFLFGATGGRLDHFLANISLLVNEKWSKSSIDFKIIDRQNIISVHRPKKYEIQKLPDKPYISFLPVNGHVEGLTLTGFKYPLHNYTAKFGSTRCISNELIEEKGTFSFTSGILMMVRSSDEMPISPVR